MTALQTPKKAVIADDHLLVRAGVRLLLESLGVEVLAEAADGQSLTQAYLAHRPDLLVIDVAMPGKTGLEALTEIRRHSSAVVALVVSNLDSVQAVQHAFDCGANGYLVKDFALAELKQALEATLQGQRYLSPRIASQALAQAAEPRGPGRLTPRQLEILRLIANGQTNKQTARTLGIAPKTVDFHRQELMRRLDVHDVAGLTRHALRLGLVVQ
jgi:DNA-binding NarL/FixJ family response regulator